MRNIEVRQESRGAGKERSRRLHWGILLICLPALAFAIPLGAGTDTLGTLGLQTPHEPLEAPAFELLDLSGKKIQLKDFRGKLVFLNFFATWCGPCREEMSGMERLYLSYHDKGLIILAINMQESAKTVRPFVQRLKLSFPAVLDTKGSVSREYGIRALPVSFLVGRDGNIRWRAMGGREWDTPQMREYFAQVVTEKK
jgi:peroxiredoxin